MKARTGTLVRIKRGQAVTRTRQIDRLRGGGPSTEFVLKRIFFTISALAACVVGAHAADPSSAPPPRTLCEVLADATTHGRKVVVSGKYYRGFEKSYLASPECKERAWVAWADGADTSSERAKRMRSHAGGGLAGLSVVVEGVFRGSGPDGRQRYGHLAAYPALIEVTAVHEIAVARK